MQRTDVNRPKEQLHVPTLQDMLDMDSEMDGGKIDRYLVAEDVKEEICIFLNFLYPCNLNSLFRLYPS